MLHSSDRILTTHVGSLPRSEAVTKMVFAEEKGERMDPADRYALLSKAVDAVVAQQCDAGVDVVSDGEMSKISYATYIKDRITGFEGDSPRVHRRIWRSIQVFFSVRPQAVVRRPIAVRSALAKSASRTARHWRRTWQISVPPWIGIIPRRHS